MYFSYKPQGIFEFFKPLENYLGPDLSIFPNILKSTPRPCLFNIRVAKRWQKVLVEKDGRIGIQGGGGGDSRIAMVTDIF